MPSKMITDRQKAAAALSGTVEVYAQQASTDFTNFLEPHLEEGATAPDLLHFQQLLGRRLDHLRQQLIAIDESHRAENQEDSLLRLQRDTATENLRQLILRLRGLIDNGWGAGTSTSRLDIGGRLPKDPVVLHRVAERLQSALRDGVLDSETPVLLGVQVDISTWVALLEDPMERLGEALHGLSQEGPETGSRQTEKTLLMKEYDRTYLATANILESLFRYVGRRDLATRVRPKQRSPAAKDVAPSGTEASTSEEAEETEGAAPEVVFAAV